jgi:two-component system, chemotaxis family, CheB/CheR fusion protein
MKKRTPVSKKKAKRNEFPLVGIGASAGGLEAITLLLKSLPADLGFAYVYIPHLNPTYKSRTVEILSRVTKIRVVQAKNATIVKPNVLYVLPYNKDMHLADGAIKLVSRKEKTALHLPIDRFFLSMAENCSAGAIGILLSGNAHDGTIGLKAIKMAGGITFAQDWSAMFQSMPKSAIAEGAVDMVMSPKEIAEELIKISKSKDVIRQVMKVAPETDVDGEEDLKVIIQLLRKETGVDFKHYKVNTIKRRIIRRMLLREFKTLNNYAKYLKRHAHEVNALYQDLLINVTSFFRDPDSLEFLKKSLLPKLIKSKQPGDFIRVWIPACSTGEEAYSFAIILSELLSDKVTNIPIQIFATDLSEHAIAKARIGVYSKNDLSDISAKRLQRYFTKVDGSYRIAKSIRDLCVFAPHNIFKDPPFSRIDLISCCNLMIYLDTILQKKLIATFHYALNRNGYLVLGKSETIGTSGGLFTPVERKFKIFQRKNNGTERAKFEMSYRVSDGDQPGSRQYNVKNKKGHQEDANLDTSVDALLLERYIPACVVVNRDLEILQFKGPISNFLEPSQGKASLNLFKMARTGLSFELRSIIHKATKSGRTETKTGIEVKSNGSVFHTSIEAVPLSSDGDERLFMIVFQRLQHAPQNDNIEAVSKDKVIKKLQHELETLKEDMRSILEEQEASVEELQSANEEVVSSNEELQSINEELETSKEEVESSNEELMTINNELQIRNEQLAESYEYAQEIFGTIRESVLVLDEHLRVRSANKAFYTTFRASEEETEGMLIFELGNRQWDIPQLRQFLYDIIPNNTMFTGFRIEHEFPIIGERVMLLNARRIIQQSHRKQLVLLAMEDITEHHRAQKVTAERELWFRNMADNAPVMIWVAGLDKRRNFVNKTWLEFTGQTQDAIKSGTWHEAIHPVDLEGYMSVYDASFMERTTFQAEYRLKRNDGEYRWMLDIAKPTYSATGGFIGYIGSCTELHNKKLVHDELEKRVARRTKALEEMNRELQRSNDELQQFAYVASHDLQEPLRKIMTFADRLDAMKDTLGDQGKTYLDKINESSKRMTRLIDDLLDYSRISRAEGKFVITDLNKVVQEVLQDFDIAFHQKRVSIKIDTLPTLSVVPLQMEQLFHNLISNAIKFTKENNAPEISISARTLTPEEVNVSGRLLKDVPYTEIVIKDNGIGFPQEYAEQIFIIFQRLNDKKHYPGTGIGLALCSRIVSNHWGEIFAKSRENEGAEFYIRLPLKRPNVVKEGG